MRDKLKFNLRSNLNALIYELLSKNMSKSYYIYIITNINNYVLYVGVTNDLQRRIYEHKNKLIKGFSEKYNLNKLVYYEIYDDVEQAILREKQIKASSRKKKEDLINSFNNSWYDLYDSLF